eukprot:scaffold1051_cov119-Cylindrotheca_fusiformis.AAC.33
MSGGLRSESCCLHRTVIQTLLFPYHAILKNHVKIYLLMSGSPDLEDRTFPTPPTGEMQRSRLLSDTKFIHCGMSCGNSLESKLITSYKPRNNHPYECPPDAGHSKQSSTMVRRNENCTSRYPHQDIGWGKHWKDDNGTVGRPALCIALLDHKRKVKATSNPTACLNAAHTESIRSFDRLLSSFGFKIFAKLGLHSFGMSISEAAAASKKIWTKKQDVSNNLHWRYHLCFLSRGGGELFCR